MRTLIFSALAATLCAAPALAQPNVAPATETVPLGTALPARPRPTDVSEQIKIDLSALTSGANNGNGFFTAYPYIYGARYGYFGANEWFSKLNRLLQYGTIQIESVNVLERNGNDARATVTYKIVPNPTFGAEQRNFWNGDHQETVALKFEPKPFFEPQDSVWKIVPPQTAPLALETSEDVAKQNVLLANIAYHVAQKQLPEQTGTPAERSMSNLKQLGLGVLQFIQDYDEVYAFDSRYVTDAITPYVHDSALFRVPDTNEIYTFNGNLSGLSIHRAEPSEKTVLFYEGQNQKPIFRYDNKAAICFADGHVALVSPEQAQKLVWKP